jgi:hypothetical protein
MRRLSSNRRPSPSLLVAVAAVVLASTGSAVAAKVMITSKDIKNGTIQVADLSKSARDALSSNRGPQGAAGANGAPGANGAAGAQGPPGPVGQPEPWHPLVLESGWAYYGAPYEEPAYRKDILGDVHVRGLVKRAGASEGTIISRLPAGYQPRRQVIFAVFAGAPDVAARVDVKPDGTVLLNTGASGYTSLAGISFSTD